ncbi:MAG: phosphoadenylyl-sulfate reductase [Zoogloeaceae bacterium]|jgi:phosphoadenosine phosphosulfate reductase|nr:phosphoadenylyl-sulfate reductase [Zoogloeaceae bacterium]
MPTSSLSSGEAMTNPATRPNLTPRLLETLATKVARAEALLAEIAAHFAPAAFANSLGAEDMVLMDLLCQHRLPVEIFTLDTGRLPPATYDLMAESERHYGVRLHIHSPRHEALEAYAREHGINAFRDSVELRKTCCRIRKVEPLERALAGKKAWITGMRAQQSATREGLPERDFDAGRGIPKFNPLADWSEREIWAYIRQHAVPYNRLHDQFYSSIGCAPCTRAISLGEDIRAGRWWWEEPAAKECGLHVSEPGG